MLSQLSSKLLLLAGPPLFWNALALTFEIRLLEVQLL
jgi:hypothetical protein